MFMMKAWRVRLGCQRLSPASSLHVLRTLRIKSEYNTLSQKASSGETSSAYFSSGPQATAEKCARPADPKTNMLQAVSFQKLRNYMSAGLNLLHSAQTMGKKGWALSVMRVLGGIGGGLAPLGFRFKRGISNLVTSLGLLPLP